jgi:hypothetical protein
VIMPNEAKKVIMTKNLNTIASSVEKLYNEGKFNKLSELFIENCIPPQELVIYYKRKNAVFSNQAFWQSDLPLLHLEKVLESDLKVSLLNSYFSKDSFCNYKISNQILQIDSKEFIRFMKFSKAFNKPSFLNSLNELKKEFPELSKLTEELSIIRQKQDQLNDETLKDNSWILQFPLIEVIIAFSISHHLFRHQSNVSGNKAFLTEVEVALIEEMSRVINLFLTNSKKSNVSFETNSEFQEYFKNKIKTLDTDKSLLSLFEQFQKMIDRKSVQGIIDLYCCGYADFTDVEKPTLKTNQSYSDFAFNNKKSQPEEFFIGNMSFTQSVETMQQNRISGQDEIKYFKYYGIPTEITFGNKTIDLHKAFKLIKHFAVFKGPLEPSNPTPNHFKAIFGGNESITLFDYTKLIKDISTFFKWDESECINIIEFLSTDLNAEQSGKNWLANPFIISQGKVLWLGTFLLDRRWENILLNKIKSEWSLRKNVTSISKNLELNTIDLFKRAGFKAFGISDFISNSGEKGEIDVLAYRDGCLIIAEVKSGNRSDSFSHARYSEIIRLEGGAAEQLDKITLYVKEEWENIKKQNGIETPKDVNKINFFPMIITDHFEGDLELYKGKYFKTSLLELDVIISNAKEKLLKSYYQLHCLANMNNDELNKKGVRINYDLWNKKSSMSAKALLNNIQTNAVWNEISEIWNLNGFECNL